jgi:hypothetical protein
MSRGKRPLFKKWLTAIEPHNTRNICPISVRCVPSDHGGQIIETVRRSPTLAVRVDKVKLDVIEPPPRVESDDSE